MSGLNRHPTGSFTNFADAVLTQCAESDLEVDWQPDRLRIRSADGEWDELTDELPGKSAFRAVIARVATLCNELAPNAVSPYGGTGELVARNHPAVPLTATFVNTVSEQSLRLARAKN